MAAFRPVPTPSARLVGAALGALTLVLGAGALEAQTPIRWRSDAPRRPVVDTPTRTRERLRHAAENPEERHVVVRFDRALQRPVVGQLADGGLTLLRPLGSHAFFASVAPDADLDALGAQPALVGADAIQPGWKLHPALAHGQTPSWSIVDPGRGANPLVAAYVLLHPDVALETGSAVVEAFGGRVVDRLESVNGLVIELARDVIPALAGADEVQWIEPPLPRMHDLALAPNDSNRVVTQANIVQSVPYSLDGRGVTVLVYDAGTARATHMDFGGRLAVHDASGLSNHATHVAGTVAGSGTSSAGRFRGMAPAAGVASYGFQYDETSIFLYTNPGDIEADYREAINSFGADLANNSIGTNTEPNGFVCNIQGDYGVTANLIDSIVRGSVSGGTPFRIVWANGNERQGSRCDLEGFGDYYSTAPPATAKNHIAVGALNSNDDTMTTFSSWGPTDDGRIKPDVSAPGCEVGADGGVTSTGSGSDSATSTLCGTSMASPTVTGLCALLLQDFRNQFARPDPRNSTLKVLLAQVAQDRGNVGPDYQFGFGSVRIQDTVDFMRLGQFTEDSVDQGGTYVYTVTVAPSTPELFLTLAWDDSPGTPNVAGSLVNDLDLRVFGPASARHYPWTLDPANPSAAAVRTGEDHANNIEQVLVTSPAAGTWRIEIHGFDVPDGPQPYSLASSHPLDVGSFVTISFPDGLPSNMTPGVGETVTAEVTGVNDSIVVGSPKLFTSYDGGRTLIEFTMTSIGGDLYQAELPPPVCTATPSFAFSAEGAISGLVTNPADAPATYFTAGVSTTESLFADDFQTNLGWTVANVSVTAGAWERGVPIGAGDRGDPIVDFDGSGACWVTENGDGNFDLDGGPTRLTSPTFDLAENPEALVRYARWFANDDFDADRLTVEVSNDNGGSWRLVETVGNTSGWTTHSFRVADFVPPTSQVRVRFNATDNPNDSVTEAALDDFHVEQVLCGGTLFLDCNQNGIVDADDVASGRSADVNHNNVPDECDYLSLPMRRR